MAITIYNIKKWQKMLSGKSVLHVNQSIGEHFCKSEIKGYYNNLKEKVTYCPQFVDSEEMPVLHTESGITFHFPVMIFQYAFGVLDLYYETNDEKYLRKFRQCADWAIDHQKADGAWDNFSYIYPDYPYGAMAQGEGISLLIRAYVNFNDAQYLESAHKAITFMLKDVKEGGCTLYEKNDIILLEYQHLPIVLNGWIFSWWGIYDYFLVTNNLEIKAIMDGSLDTLVRYLPQFSNGYWSMYDINGKITSPFYHNLHIAQMKAMYALTQIPEFDIYAKKWEKEQSNALFKSIAFIKKSFQKIIER